MHFRYKILKSVINILCNTEARKLASDASRALLSARTETAGSFREYRIRNCGYVRPNMTRGWKKETTIDEGFLPKNTDGAVSNTSGGWDRLEM
jgi:hypothetical protein